jgi:hypothetical protein
MASSPKLFDQVRQVLRVRHYAYETEKSYIHWIKRFIAFHHMKPPREMGAAEVEAFLTYLAVNLKVAPSTQNQALSALIFLYREVYGQDTDWGLNAVRARPTRYLPTVLSPEEVQAKPGWAGGEESVGLGWNNPKFGLLTDSLAA